jgi:hypothetical protein
MNVSSFLQLSFLSQNNLSIKNEGWAMGEEEVKGKWGEGKG